MLPQLELLEAAECCLLACTVAWDAGAAASELPPSVSEQAGLGCALAADAVAQAQRVLARLVPPASEAAAAVDVQRLSEAHCPDRQQWQQAVGALLQALEEAPQQGHQPGTSLVNMDLGLARQEYLQNGQQVGRGQGRWGLAARGLLRGRAALLGTRPGGGQQRLQSR
jgi:isochorismate synthase/2-succinyl-5-enolpyruvyl-6-hydroxy-3-cyclohexene-1-carboxylate synthase/2-succinyl-6-hydroxy-2,4-cyclohexadiene-1-carboxylate synthase/O-succinylbenzoate synthase